MSTFGSLFRVTTYGESHCPSVGAIVDGVPPVSHNSYSRAFDLQLFPGPPPRPLRHPGPALPPQTRPEQPHHSRASPQPRSPMLTHALSSATRRTSSTSNPASSTASRSAPRSRSSCGTRTSALKTTPRPTSTPARATPTTRISQSTASRPAAAAAAAAPARRSVRPPVLPRPPPHARPCAGRVAAGAIAEKYLREAHGVEIVAFVSSVGKIRLPSLVPRATAEDDDAAEDALTPEFRTLLATVTREDVDRYPTRCPHAATSERMIEVRPPSTQPGPAAHARRRSASPAPRTPWTRSAGR